MSDATAADDERDEVAACSDAYEDALRRNDVTALNGFFWDDPEVLRFGVADQQTGHDAIVAWRRSAPPIRPDRTITARRIVALGPGVVAVDLTFADDDATVGRQSQTWIRTADGWRIARAHVSVIACPPP